MYAGLQVREALDARPDTDRASAAQSLATRAPVILPYTGIFGGGQTTEQLVRAVREGMHAFADAVRDTGKTVPQFRTGARAITSHVKRAAPYVLIGLASAGALSTALYYYWT